MGGDRPGGYLAGTRWGSPSLLTEWEGQQGGWGWGVREEGLRDVLGEGGCRR